MYACIPSLASEHMSVMAWCFVYKTQQRTAFQSFYMSCMSTEYFSLCVSFFYTFVAVDHVLCLIQ